MKKHPRRPRKPQVQSLIALNALLPEPSQGTFTSHFRRRMEERSFDLRRVTDLWNGLNWIPEVDDRWRIEEPIEGENQKWSIVVEFAPDDTPIFITICSRFDVYERAA